MNEVRARHFLTRRFNGGRRVRLWHIASVIAVQRHVRSWRQTGRDWHTAKVTLLTPSDHAAYARRAASYAHFGAMQHVRQTPRIHGW